MIETSSTIKHETHVSNFTDIPVTNGLVKVGCAKKHFVHGFDTTDIPSADVLVKTQSPVKNKSH